MFLSTGNFESGLGAWQPLNLSQAVTTSLITSPGEAKQGDKFMRFKTSQRAGSVAHDVGLPAYVQRVVLAGGNLFPTYAAIANSLQFSVWLKSAPGQGNIDGVVAIWDLTANISTSTRFSVGPAWTQVFAGLDRTTLSARAEIYLDTIDQWIDVDAAVLV